METNEMTPEQSLQVISDAIAKSRRDFEKNAGTPLILWGSVVVVFSFVVWILLKMTGNICWNFLWFGVPAAGWPLSAILLKGKCAKGGNSFISRSLGEIWIAYGVFATVLSAVFAFLHPEYIGYFTAILLGFASTITGLVLKNRFITVGGFITGLGCTIALFLVQKNDVTLFFAAAALLNLIIPGVMMNRKSN